MQLVCMRIYKYAQPGKRWSLSRTITVEHSKLYTPPFKSGQGLQCEIVLQDRYKLKFGLNIHIYVYEHTRTYKPVYN